MLSGRRDALVPPAQMAELRRLREQNGGKVTWREFDGEHNDTYLAEGYWAAVESWLKEFIHGEKVEQ
jgi:predicted esterase